MLEWLYRSTTSQTTDTDAEGKAVTKEVWEAKFLWGQIVYQSAKVAPGPSAGAPASSQPPVSQGASPTATSPSSTGAGTKKPEGPTKPVTLADRVARESHWLDVDRTADSRAQSPDLPDAAENVQRRRSVGVLGYTLLGDAVARGNQEEGKGNGRGKGKRERYESTWVDVDRTEDSRAESPELDEGVGVGEVVGRSGEKKGSPLADPRNN